MARLARGASLGTCLVASQSTTGTAGCGALSGSGQIAGAVAAPPRSVMNSPRLIPTPSRAEAHIFCDKADAGGRPSGNAGHD